MRHRHHPKFWHGKVRVFEVIKCGDVRYTAQWRTFGAEEWYWTYVTPKGVNEPITFETLGAAKGAAMDKWDNDPDVWNALRRKVWP